MVFLYSLLQLCTVFFWERVHFVHSSLCSVLFWIWGERRWKYRGVLVIVEPCLHSISAFSALPSAPTMRKLGKKTQLGLLTPTGQREIPVPHSTMPNKKVLQEREKVGGIFWAMAFAFPCKVYVWQSPALLKMDDGKEWINFLFCFACGHSFCFPS